MVGLIDCDNFFCSCERVFRPDLARTPLVVLSNNDGCVVARSAEVKAMGIPEGMPYYQLREQYPQAGIVAFSSNYALYADMSARVVSILRDAAPDVIQYSIDEAFLDLTGLEHLDLQQWGRELCHTILRSTGMPVSLGIAPTCTLAKMASKFAKRYRAYRKCCVIGNDTQRHKALNLFSVSDVWGIGRRISRHLQNINVTTAADFAELPQAFVRRKFHVTGERTWKELNGMPCIQVDGLDTVSKKTIVTSRSFPAMLTDIADLRSHIANYAARCALKLRRQKSVCALVTAFVQSNHFRDDLPQYAGSASYAFATATSTTGELVTAATGILDKIYRKGIHYKRAGVMVSGISPSESFQPDLFEFDPDHRRKHNDLSSALDRINGRMGADMVVLGAQQYREKAPDGKSIKFVNAIRRAMKSPNYSTSLDALTVG